MGEEEKKMKRVMVTFDVDGTLIKSTGNSSNRLHRQAFSHAFYQVFGLKDVSIDAIQEEMSDFRGPTIYIPNDLMPIFETQSEEVNSATSLLSENEEQNEDTLETSENSSGSEYFIHHGQTDPLILVNTLVHYGIPSDVASERLPDLMARMIEYAKEHAQNIGEGLEVLPGVSFLLDALSSKGVAVGLVTGNLEEIAWMKMEGLGIQKYFTIPKFGGFGTDHTERGELIKIAANRANKLYPDGFDLRVHVGDTPNDIRAAENGGALAIGVCTGVFMAEELQKASNGNAVILPDLTNAEAILKLLGI